MAKTVEVMQADSRSDDEIENEWRAAKLFIAKGPSATLQYLKDDAKALLFALDAQAVDGPLSQSGVASSPLMDPALSRKHEAWKSLGDMSRSEAKRRFLELLTAVFPEWKEWHTSRSHEVDVSTDTASRILSEFSKKTGIVLRSSL